MNLTKRLNNTIISVATILGLGLLPRGALAATQTVSNTADSGAGSLRQALANAGNGDTIDASGLTGTITLLTGELEVTHSVNILGSGPAHLIVNGNYPNTTNRVFHINRGLTVNISGLTIENGSVSGCVGGGGIYNDHSTLAVTNCLFTGNSAQVAGGAIYNDGSDLNNSSILTVSGSSFAGNSAGFGGAIHNYSWISTNCGANCQAGGNASATVIDSSFLDNSAGTGGAIGAMAGGFASGGLSLVVTNCTFRNNSAVRAGAIHFEPGNDFGGDCSGGVVGNYATPKVFILQILGSSFIGNSASEDGGAVYQSLQVLGDYSLFPLVAGCTFTGNYSQNHGGALYNFAHGYATVTNCLFASNSATNRGGAVYNASDTLNLISSGFWSNWVAFPSGGSAIPLGADCCSGGAIYNDGRFFPVALAITNCTFNGNVAFLGGGIYNYGFLHTANTFIHNTSFITNGGIAGGGILNHIEGNSSLMQISSSTVNDNSALDGGALFNAAQGVVEIDILGTLLRVAPGTARIDILQSTLSHNAAVNDFNPGAGGAILNLTGHTNGLAVVNILNSTLADNWAVGVGGASIYNDNSADTISSTSLVVIASSILKAGISGGNISNVLGSISSRGFNLSSDAGGGFLTGPGDLLNTDPLLGPLQDNGGPTFTHALSCASPAVDGGSNFLAFATDQRGSGFNRTVDSPGLSNPPGGDGTDIGAYELQTLCTNHPPVAVCQSLTLSAGPNCTASASIDNGSYDPDGDPITIVQTSAGPFPLGTNHVTLTVTDSHGATNSCSALVIVNDTTPPNIVTCAAAVTNSADANCQAPVPDFTTNVFASDNCPLSGQLTFSQSPAAGTLLTLGTTNVTIYVSDPSGNTNTCSTTFTVVDTTPPSLTCPGSMVVSNDPGQCAAVVNYTVNASDNCGSVTVSEDSPPGTMFPVGTNTVNVTAVDAAGNTNTCSFTITVQDTEPPAVICIPAPNPSGKIQVPGKGAYTPNPNGYYQLLVKDNCDPNPSIYVKDTSSSFVAGPFHNGDIVRLKHTGGAPSSGTGNAPVLAVINLNGNAITVGQDASGNVTPDAAGCQIAVTPNP